jgi:hypothetical protein
MDIAYYISDLLGQQGELTVPNLGYFVQIRMAAYYDNQAKKFFPPHYSVQFDPQTIDEDDSLANYITGIKNISPASAKYFIEKYIANLKSQAMIEDVPFANLGSFSSDGLKLNFTSATKMDDPAFFAFHPLDVYKIGDTHAKKPVSQSDFSTAPPVQTSPPVASSTPLPIPQSDSAPIVTPAEAEPELEEAIDEEYYEDEPRRRFGVWMILLIVLTLVVIALGGLYKFRPDLFNQYIPIFKKPAVVKQPTPVAKPDTIINKAADSLAKKDSVKKDSIPAKIDTPKTAIKKPEAAKPQAIKPVVTETKKPAPVVVAPPVNKPTVTIPANSADAPIELAKGLYVIYAGAFPIRSMADKRLIDLKSRGFSTARLLTEKVARGGNYKVIIGGGYQTRKEAVDATVELIATGKIKSSDMYVDKIR